MSTAVIHPPVELNAELITLADRLAGQFAQLPLEFREMVADRVAAQLVGRMLTPGLVVEPPTEAVLPPVPLNYRAPAIATAGQMCDELGFKRSWAYAHRAELGARKMGDGPKARMRFDMEVARAYWASLALTAPQSAPSPRRRRTKKSGAPTAASTSWALNVPSWSFA